MNFFEILALLGNGCLVSLSVFLLTLLFALPLGLLICFGRMARFRPLSVLFRFYISVMRGTPLMLQLFVVYYGPYYLFRIRLSELGSNWLFLAVIIGFTLNYAAYFAEIYRAGISAMSAGQYEAARVLGMTRSQTFFLIILPQVFRNILPALGNEIITLVKDTSIAFAIGLIEMFTRAKLLASEQVSLLPYLVAGCIYYFFNLAVSFTLSQAEKHLSRYRIK